MNNEYENIDTSKLELASNKKRLYSFVIDDLLVTFIAMFLLWTPIQNSNVDYEQIH